MTCYKYFTSCQDGMLGFVADLDVSEVDSTRYIPVFEGKGYPTAEEAELDELLDDLLPDPDPVAWRKAVYQLVMDAKIGEHKLAAPRQWVKCEPTDFRGLPSFHDEPLNAYLGRLGYPDAKPTTPTRVQQAFGTGQMFEASPPKPELTIERIMDVATSLFIGCDDVGYNSLYGPGHADQYLRGVCELVGRIKLDLLGEGEGTSENALAVSSEIDMRLKAGEPER